MDPQKYLEGDKSSIALDLNNNSLHSRDFIDVGFLSDVHDPSTLEPTNIIRPINNFKNNQVDKIDFDQWSKELTMTSLKKKINDKKKTLNKALSTKNVNNQYEYNYQNKNQTNQIPITNVNINFNNYNNFANLNNYAYNINNNDKKKLNYFIQSGLLDNEKPNYNNINTNSSNNYSNSNVNNLNNVNSNIGIGMPKNNSLFMDKLEKDKDKTLKNKIQDLLDGIDDKDNPNPDINHLKKSDFFNTKKSDKSTTNTYNNSYINTYNNSNSNTNSNKLYTKSNTIAANVENTIEKDYFSEIFENVKKKNEPIKNISNRIMKFKSVRQPDKNVSSSRVGINLQNISNRAFMTTSTLRPDNKYDNFRIIEDKLNKLKQEKNKTKNELKISLNVNNYFDNNNNLNTDNSKQIKDRKKFLENEIKSLDMLSDFSTKKVVSGGLIFGKS